MVRYILGSYPKINEVCNEIHIDFTDASTINYGLSSIGDTLLQSDILGNQTRQHNFILYAVYQSYNDYDRLSNSGVLLDLQHWLEHQAENQMVSVTVGDKILTGILTNLNCANAMVYEIPYNNTNSVWQYQMQIAAKYQIESEEI